MAQYPVAVLKFMWADTPYINGIPANLTYSDAVINRLFFPLSQAWWGVANYWTYCSFGTINLEGTQVFPWRKLDGINAPTASNQYSREQLINQAISQAKNEGWPLDDFTSIVLWVAPSASNPQDAGSGPYTIDGKWAWCVLFESSNHDFYAHEYGHALRFKHVWGLPSRLLNPKPYQDPYCIMAAQYYLSRDPTFSISADPAGPPIGDAYWASMALMPSAAMLYTEVPDFAASHHVRKLGAVAAGWQPSVTLRARDLTHGNDPVLAVVETGAGADGRLAYLVELRRSRDWDRGLGVTNPASPPAGVVIHSHRNLDEFPNDTFDLETNPTAVYEGNIELPLTSGDGDWYSPTRDFVVRVNGFADDLSWVDLTFGGADLLVTGAVMLDIVRGGTSELVEEGEAENVPVFICGSGTYHFYIDHEHTQLRCTATAFGYDSPQFTWQVNGITVPSSSVFGSISVPVLATFPRPTSKTESFRNAKVSYLLNANELELVFNPADGNYNVDVSVAVQESNSVASPATPSSIKRLEKIETILISWEKRYYDDVQKCIGRIRDLNEKYAISRVRWPRINPGDPAYRVRLLLETMKADLQTINPLLTEHIDYTLSNYSGVKNLRASPQNPQ